jgi:hypothetical protein
VEWPSIAEGQRYQGVLYIEKEGFEPVMKEARIAERFDLAILSCKGQSVVAARRYVDEVCRVDGGVPLFVVHDFDKSGFEISQCLTTVSDWAREKDRVQYDFKNKIRVIDLGLRLADAEHYTLASEAHTFGGNFAPHSIATEAEREFLRSNRRVELNAFTSPQFVEWLETKIRQHLKTRLIPSDDVLEAAYRRAVAVAYVNKMLEAAPEEAQRIAAETTVPAALRQMVDESSEAWDRAIYRIVDEGGAV